MDLFGKTAIVAGGSGDIGIAIVKGYLDAGVEQIVVLDKASPSREFEGGQKVKWVKTDLSKNAYIDKCFKSALAILSNRLDIFINCAGVQVRHPPLEFGSEAWDLVMQINLTAGFELMKRAAVPMVKSRSGKIINVTSIMAEFGGKQISAYAASKGALAQLTKSFCNDLAELGVNVNSIAPGYIKTKLNQGLYPNSTRMTEITNRIPQGRWGRPEDLVGAAVFLASGSSDYINGATITIDGGYSVR